MAKNKRRFFRMNVERESPTIAFTRWAWLRRPIWMGAILTATTLIGAIIWPIPLYRPEAGTFIMMDQGRGRFLGMAVVARYPSPRRAQEELDRKKMAALRFEEGNDGQVWIFQGSKAELCFLRGNLLATLAPPLPPETSQEKDGTNPAGKNFEKIARDIDQGIRDGILGGRKVHCKLRPRGLVCLFPDGSDWDEILHRGRSWLDTIRKHFS